MLLETVLVFVMNTQSIKMLTIPTPAPLNYCVGYQVHQSIYMTCKRMDERIYDYLWKQSLG